MTEEQVEKTDAKYTDAQFARYVTKTLFKKICDIETAINFMHDGKFFAAESKMVGVRDSLIFLKNQADVRLKELGAEPETQQLS